MRVIKGSLIILVVYSQDKLGSISGCFNELGCCSAKQHNTQAPRQSIATTDLIGAVTLVSLPATLWTVNSLPRVTVFEFWRRPFRNSRFGETPS